MKKTLLMITLVCLCLGAATQEKEPPVKAPFDKLDLYCVNDWWNHAKQVKNNPKRIIDVDVPRDEVICFG
ncbi:hypothetical protein K8I31_01960, partial [bacterium]|nr:hypothetical protein [bacterium]